MYQILPSNLMLIMFFLVLTIMFIKSFISFEYTPTLKKLQTQNKDFEKKIIIMSLFTSFDPNSSMKLLFFQNMNWLVIILIMVILNTSYFSKMSRISIFYNNLFNSVSNQFAIALKSKKDGSKSFFLLIFLLIFLLNIMGLVPNLFTPSSHLTFNLIISVSLWTGFMLYGWTKFNKKMFAHLVPLSTPTPLISFMVLIETVSNVIRPGTLSIRLMANMVSGHLLLTLMGNSMENSMLIILMFIILMQNMLMILEMSVASIQAYVFSVLLTLYSDESDYN